MGSGQQHHFIHMDVVRDNVSQPYPNQGVHAPTTATPIDVEVISGSEDPSDVVF